MPKPAVHTLDLDHGVELRCSVPSLDGSVRVAVAFLGRELFSSVFRPDGPPHAVRHDGDLVDVSLELEVDAFDGEVAVGGHLRVRPPFDDDWHTVLDVDREVLLRFSPGIGQIGASSAVQEPLIVDPSFGRSQLCTPAILRIFVDDEDRAVSRAGSLVKRHLFPDHPSFTFNTVACVGQPDGEDEPGLYTSPASHWFNVFFGYYQLDAPKADWTRPFGYRSANGLASEIEVEDVVRLGKSDWNFFSNWMYGVPDAAVERCNGIDMASMPVHRGPAEQIGATLWHPLVIDDVEVASAYESDAPGAARLVENSELDDIWRHAFGLPNPHPDWKESFIPTRLRASVWMAYWEDADAFHTTIFGGTLPKGGDQAFLDLQMRSVRTVIERSYQGLGFPAAG